MNDHLSEDQVAKVIVGEASRLELEHIHTCAKCKTQVAHFEKAVSLFRSAVRDRIDDQAAAHPLSANTRVTFGHGNSMWRWALITATVAIMVTLPFFRNQNKPQEVREQVPTETDPKAIMDAVNRHLSRVLPAPMEPMLFLLPSEETVPNSGGIQ